MTLSKQIVNGRLARRLGLYVILASTFISLFTSGIQIYAEYQREVNEVHADLHQIETTHLNNIAARVWVLDIDELLTTLNSLLGLSAIEYVAVYENGKLFTSVGTDTDKDVVVSNNQLVYENAGKKNTVGRLIVKASLESAYQHIIDQAVIILVSNSIKTFIVAGLILLIFYRLVGRHLNQVAGFAEQISIDTLDRQFEFDRKKSLTGREDELDLLNNALFKMQSNLADATQNLKESQVTLARSEAMFRGVLESAADGVVLVDGQGQIILVNTSMMKMTGYAEAELINQPLEILVPDRFSQHRQHRQIYHNNMQKRRMGVGLALFVRRKDGTEFPVDISLTPVQLETNTIVAAMIQDITLRKQAEDEKETLLHTLKDKNEELERFTYTASHDLKSPLVTISGFIGLLKRDIAAGDEARIHTDLGRITYAAATMQQLLDDLLALSRIGRKSVPRTQVSLPRLIHNVLEMLAGKIKETQATILVDDELPILTVEEPRIKEVYLNLIENALKYHCDDAKPNISVGVRHAGQGTKDPVLFVKDNGVGIDPRYQNKVFGLFERLNNTSEGSGVGLAIVKRIIELHNGRIWIESDGQGHGTVFCFVIPADTL